MVFAIYKLLHTICPQMVWQNVPLKYLIKQGICKQSTGTLNDKISRLQFQYCITPHSTTGMAPAEMLIGRRLRSRLDLLKPSTEQRIANKQQQQRKTHDKHCRKCTFSGGGESVCYESS